MNIPYRQLFPEEALGAYGDWLVAQLADLERCGEWYMVFYPVRTLALAGKRLKQPRFLDTAFRYVDAYLSEQLPNGAFTSNRRRQPTSSLTKRQFHEILRTGKVNLADNGSNVTGVLQAAGAAEGERRARYLAAARKWLDEWVPVWALPEGGYGNGIWVGHKINSPYTCAIGTVCAALSAYTLATGEREFVENAERAMKFQCDHWLPDGRPINFDCYPLPRKTALNDYGHSFYLLEGMIWTHHVSRNEEVRTVIAKRLKEWIFGEEGLLSQWRGSWFNFQVSSYPPDWEANGCGLPMSRLGLRLGWELAKSNGILHALLYYLNHVEENAALREKVESGLRYLSHPLKARMSGICSDPEESYGEFAVQATGFAGLSLADGIQNDLVFTSLGCKG